MTEARCGTRRWRVPNERFRTARALAANATARATARDDAHAAGPARRAPGAPGHRTGVRLRAWLALDGFAVRRFDIPREVRDRARLGRLRVQRVEPLGILEHARQVRREVVRVAGREVPAGRASSTSSAIPPSPETSSGVRHASASRITSGAFSNHTLGTTRRSVAHSCRTTLGATMFHALCGRPPIQGESVAEILSGVLYQPIPEPRQLRPQLSRGVALVVRKCLARDPDRRYQEPHALLADLERIRERRTPEVRASSLDPVAGEGTRWRHPLLLGGLALVLGVAGWFGFRASVEHRTGDAITSGPDSWPQIDQVRAKFESGRTLPQAALFELERMNVPDSFRVSANALKTDLLADLDRRVDDWRGELKARFDALLEEHDWPAIAELLNERAERDLAASTGYPAVGELPAGRRQPQAIWLAELARSASRAEEAARNEVARLLREHYADVVRPQIEALATDRQWTRALAVIERAPVEWMRAAGADLRGFEGDGLRHLESTIDVERNTDRKNLRADWLQVGGELMRAVDRTQETLRAQLEDGDARGVGDRLREAFRARLEREGVSADQVPAGWDQRPFRYAERIAAELEAREARLVETFARQSVEDDALAAKEMCSRREYGAALERWNRRLADPLFEFMAPELRERARECELLQSLLERAAAGVLDRDGESFECWVGNIRERGTIRASADPLRKGFELDSGTRRIVVRLVRPADRELASSEVVLLAPAMEELAGLSGSSLAPEERLVEALFRYYEADLAGAQAALPVGELEDDPLLESLQERIAAALARATAEERERERDLESSMRNIKWNFERSQYVLNPGKLLNDINAVRARFGDLLSSKNRDDLRGIEEALERALSGPTIEAVFGPFAPGDIVRRPPLDVEMTFRFGAGAAGSWNRGSWAASDSGWALEGGLKDDAALVTGGAPSLALAEPFDARARIRVLLEFEPVWTAGQGNAVLVSLAGFHVALLDDPASPRVLVDTSDPADVLRRIRRGDTSGFGGFRGLTQDASWTLDVSINPAAGQLDHVRVDGVDLEVRGHYLRPALEPVLEVRSLEPVRLVRAQLIGRRMR